MENQNIIQRGRFKCYICPANEHSNGRVVAVTTYKGRTVRGVAVCSPEDEFDVQYGCDLAIARCEVKIADIRCDIYEDEYNKAVSAYTKAKLMLHEALSHWISALNADTDANDAYNNILNKQKRRKEKLKWKTKM